MSWVLLRKKLATSVAPPKMSIHWATPFPMKKQAENEQKRNKLLKQYQAPEIKRCLGAMRIYFLGEEIRIFPEEFSELDNSRLMEYISTSHELIEDSMKRDGKFTVVDIKSKQEQLIYEAALLDGCTEIQALNVMKEKEPSNSVIPVMGWYRAKPEYAAVFCTKEEAEITDTRKRSFKSPLRTY